MRVLTRKYELLLRGVSLEDLRRHSTEGRGRRWSPNVLRARDDGTLDVLLKSAIGPRLNAVVLDDDQGVKVVGTLRWTRHLLNVVFCGVAAVGLCAVALLPDSN